MGIYCIVKLSYRVMDINTDAAQVAHMAMDGGRIGTISSWSREVRNSPAETMMPADQAMLGQLQPDLAVTHPARKELVVLMLDI